MRALCVPLGPLQEAPMRTTFVLALILVLQTIAAGQVADSPSPPPVMRFSSSLRAADGAPHTAGIVNMVFALYGGQTGGDALWTETQNVQVSADGRYTVLLGTASQGGLPVDL